MEKSKFKTQMVWLFDMDFFGLDGSWHDRNWHGSWFILEVYSSCLTSLIEPCFKIRSDWKNTWSALSCSTQQLYAAWRLLLWAFFVTSWAAATNCSRHSPRNCAGHHGSGTWINYLLHHWENEWEDLGKLTQFSHEACSKLAQWFPTPLKLTMGTNQWHLLRFFHQH